MLIKGENLFVLKIPIPAAPRGYGWNSIHRFRLSPNIALLPIPSEFGVYDAKRLNKSCSVFEGRKLNVCYTTFI